MKKIILTICVAVMLFGLIGCKDNNNEKVNNVSGDNINNEIIDNEENNLTLEIDAYNNFFNVALSKYDLEESFYNDNYTFESNGKEYVLSTKRLEENAIGIELLINGEKFEDDYYSICGVAVVDIDKEDNEKEIILKLSSDGFDHNVLYKIDSDGNLVEYFKDKAMVEQEPCYYNGKFIMPVNLVVKAVGPVIGYYEYDNGEFKYVDKCLNGEQSTDENGYLIEKIQNEVYDCNAELSFITKGEKEIKSNATFQIIKVRFEFNETENKYEKKYDIKLLDDAEWGDDNTTEILPEGTILEDVNYTYLYC